MTLDPEQLKQYWDVEDGVVGLKRATAENVGAWNTK